METNVKTRRVGSWTLGLVLVVCGVCFLLYYFWPSFNWLLAVKLSPLCLIALGAEVLYFSAKPDKGRYDFLSILGCLFLVCCCFGASLIPMMWQTFGPEREQSSRRIENQFEQAMYEQLQAGDISSINVMLDTDFGENPTDTAQLDGSETLWMRGVLAESFADENAFAAKCSEVFAAAKRTMPTLDSAELYSAPDAEGKRYFLNANTPYQLDWSAEQLAAQVTTENVNN